MFLFDWGADGAGGGGYCVMRASKVCGEELGVCLNPGRWLERCLIFSKMRNGVKDNALPGITPHGPGSQLSDVKGDSRPDSSVIAVIEGMNGGVHGKGLKKGRE